MAEIHWAQPRNGDFSDPGRWLGGVVPGAGDDAILDASGGSTGVKVTQNATINSIQLNSATALLVETGVVFTAIHGTGVGADAGQIFVSPGATLAVGLAMDITGDLTLGCSGGGKANFATVLIQATTTLSGGGTVNLSSYAGNHIRGLATARTRLVNFDDYVQGSGTIGGGQLVFVNAGHGRVIGTGSTPLIIDTGSRTVVNDGLMESQGPAGVLTIRGALENNGKILAAGGPLTVVGVVTGGGSAEIEYGATLALLSSFSQNVRFRDLSGTLALARSQAFTATITGFSGNRATVLDLADIGFVGSSEASFSGTRTGGVLTVSDGAHTSSLSLRGDYLGDIFTSSSDSHGGTSVVAAKGAPLGQTQGFLTAMAAMAPTTIAGTHARGLGSSSAPVLFGPRSGTH